MALSLGIVETSVAWAWSSESIVEGLEAAVVKLLHLPYQVKMEKLSQEPLHRFWHVIGCRETGRGRGLVSSSYGLSHAEGIVSAKYIGQLEISPCGRGNRGTTV